MTYIDRIGKVFRRIYCALAYWLYIYVKIYSHIFTHLSSTHIDRGHRHIYQYMKLSQLLQGFIYSISYMYVLHIYMYYIYLHILNICMGLYFRGKWCTFKLSFAWTNEVRTLSGVALSPFMLKHETRKYCPCGTKSLKIPGLGMDMRASIRNYTCVITLVSYLALADLLLQQVFCSVWKTCKKKKEENIELLWHR